MAFPETEHRGSSDGDEAEGAKLKDVEMTEQGVYDMDPLKMEGDGETKGEEKMGNPLLGNGHSEAATMLLEEKIDDSAGLRSGDRITVIGTSRDDLNGQSGTVKDYDAAQERFNVTLDNGKVFALRSRNLQKLKGDGEAKGETKGGRGEKEGASPSKGLQALRDAEIDRLDRNLYGAKKGSPEKSKKGSPGR